MAGNWVSPNQMMEAAKKHMLEGREPQSQEDWAQVVNFFAANIMKGMEEVCVPLVCKLFDVPLPDEFIIEVCKFQMERK